MTKEEFETTIEKEDEAKFIDAFMYVNGLDISSEEKLSYFMIYLKGLFNGHDAYGKESLIYPLIIDIDKLIRDAIDADIDSDIVWQDISNNIAEYYIIKERDK